MTIIDLLVKIANGEETPKYITYYNRMTNEYATMMVSKENLIYKLDQKDIELNDNVIPVGERKKDSKRLIKEER